MSKFHDVAVPAVRLGVLLQIAKRRGTPFPDARRTCTHLALEDVPEHERAATAMALSRDRDKWRRAYERKRKRSKVNLPSGMPAGSGKRWGRR